MTVDVMTPERDVTAAQVRTNLLNCITTPPVDSSQPVSTSPVGPPSAVVITAITNDWQNIPRALCRAVVLRHGHVTWRHRSSRIRHLLLTFYRWPPGTLPVSAIITNMTAKMVSWTIKRILVFCFAIILSLGDNKLNFFELIKTTVCLKRPDRYD